MLILDYSQPDCPPCQQMAREAPAFLASMVEEGRQIQLVTFLGNGLGDPTGEPSSELVQAWIEGFGSHGVVYRDRGFAGATIGPFLAEASGGTFGFPAWVMVDRRMGLAGAGIGYGGWESMADAIRSLDDQ